MCVQVLTCVRVLVRKACCGHDHVLVSGSMDYAFEGDGKTFFGVIGEPDEFHIALLAKRKRGHVLHCQNLGRFKGKEVTLPVSLAVPANKHRITDQEHKYFKLVRNLYSVRKR